MSKPISRKELVKELMPGIKALFDVYDPVYEIIKRKDGYALIERTHGMADDVIIAKNLSKKEVYTLYNITTGESIK